MKSHDTFAHGMFELNSRIISSDFVRAPNGNKHMNWLLEYVSRAKAHTIAVLKEKSISFVITLSEDKLSIKNKTIRKKNAEILLNFVPNTTFPFQSFCHLNLYVCFSISFRSCVCVRFSPVCCFMCQIFIHPFRLNELKKTRFFSLLFARTFIIASNDDKMFTVYVPDANKWKEYEQKRTQEDKKTSNKYLFDFIVAQPKTTQNILHL